MKALGKVCKDAFVSLIHFTELRKIGRNGMTVPGYNSISKSVCVSEGGGRGGQTTFYPLTNKVILQFCHPTHPRTLPRVTFKILLCMRNNNYTPTESQCFYDITFYKNCTY